MQQRLVNRHLQIAVVKRVRGPPARWTDNLAGAEATTKGLTHHQQQACGLKECEALFKSPQLGNKPSAPAKGSEMRSSQAAQTKQHHFG
jgi:hypothetical protein